MTYRERRLAKAERLSTWADKRRAKSDASFKTARTIADGIPLGQPILIGHHSERRHRRDVARIDNGMRRGIEHERKAGDMESRAANIIAAADSAIYSDDPDAIDALKAKLARLEAERDRIKEINRMIRKRGLIACLPDLTPAEQKELTTTARLCPYHQVETRGYPAYHSSNLSGNITRTRKRIASLSGTTAAPKYTMCEDCEACFTAAQHIDGKLPPHSFNGKPCPGAGATTYATATARAGLTVTPGMTTPSRAGKQPRPVWTVTGNLAFWRPLLANLGGNWYRGAFSFWDDPSADIETACLESEADEQAKAAQS